MTELLSKKKMLIALKSGKVISHKYFSEDEWMIWDGIKNSVHGKICFEDGCKISLDSFLSIRKSDYWAENWFVVEKTDEIKKLISKYKVGTILIHKGNI